MTCDVTLVIDWGGVLEMFSKPLSKCPSWLSYILFIAFHPVTLIPIYDATLLGDVVSIFGFHQEVFDGLASSEVDLYAIFLAGVFKTFTKTFAVWNSYVGSSGDWLGVVVCQPLSFVSGLYMNPGLLFDSVQGPSWIFAWWKGLLNVFLFFFQLLFGGTYFFCPVE